MAQRLVTVFGGSGFVGHSLVKRLAQDGWRVRVAVRDIEAAKSVKPMGEVGQISVIEADIKNAESVRRAVSGAQAVINLVGILYERGASSFQAIHVEGAEAVAKAAAEAGAQSFVQMSAIGASKQSPSAYARSKAEGEDRVRAAFPKAVIIRPSVIFGPDDAFYNGFAAIARVSPFLPVFVGKQGGKDGIRLQPVYVGDVADAIANALASPEAAGKTYELGGPQVYTLRQIMEQVAHETRREPRITAISTGWARLASKVLRFLPKPPLTPDMVVQLEIDNVVSEDLPGLSDLGVTPTLADAVLPDYLGRYRCLHRMIRRLGNRVA